MFSFWVRLFLLPIHFAYQLLPVWLTVPTWNERHLRLPLPTLRRKVLLQSEKLTFKANFSPLTVIITYHPLQERNHADEWNNVCTGFDIPQNILITQCLLFEMFRFYFNRIKSQCRINCELLVTLLHGGTGCIDATRQFKSWVLTTLLMSHVCLKDRQGWGTCSWHLFLCLENRWATTWTKRSIVQKIYNTLPAGLIRKYWQSSLISSLGICIVIVLGMNMHCMGTTLFLSAVFFG